MEKQIFIINGTGGSGKDSFVDFIDVALKGFVSNVSSVEPARAVAKTFFGMKDKTEKDRKFLSDLKKLLSDYNDLPFRYMTHEVSWFKAQDKSKLIFLHIREPEEIERAKTEFNAKTILVRRKGLKDIISNSSDANVYSYIYDITVNNDGTLEDLAAKATEFLRDAETGEFKTIY